MTEVRLTHIGGPTVLLEILGWRLLTDPTFDPPGRRYRFGWGTGSTKLVGPAIPTEEVGPLDAILLSHDQHGDNLDQAGRVLLDEANAVVTTERGAKRLGGKADGLDAWETTSLEAPGRPRIEITATPCRHGPPLSRPLAGPVVGFALRVEGDGEPMIWISGDTVLYSGVRQVAERLDVDLVLLHLGDVQFPVTGPLRYSMTAKEAVELCALIEPQVAIPVHYEGWKHFHEGRGSIEREFAKAPEDLRRRTQWLELGAPRSFDLASPRRPSAGQPGPLPVGSRSQQWRQS